MIRRLARLILRRELGALRARVHALEAKVVSVTDMAAHFKAEVDAFHAMHSRVVDERDALQKRALRPDLGVIEAAFMAGWDKGYCGGSIDRLAVKDYDPGDECNAATDAYMDELTKEPA